MLSTHKHIFFIRNSIDGSFNRRLINAAEKSITISLFDWDPEYQLDHVIVSNLKEKLFYKLLKVKPLKNTILKYFLKKLDTFLSLYDFDNEVHIFFDHNNDLLLRKVHDNVKNKLTARSYALPHADLHLENFIVDKHWLCPPKKMNLQAFDRVLVTSEKQRSILHGNTMIIEELALLSINVLRQPQQKRIKLSIVHTKFIGNVNEDEFFRSVKMILHYASGYNIKLKLHPRCSLKERNKIIACVGRENIFNGSIGDLFNQSEMVLHFQSSCSLEALSAGCQVILLNYVTANKLKPEIRQYCSIFDTPDDLYHFLINGADLSEYQPEKLFRVGQEPDGQEILRRITKW